MAVITMKYTDTVSAETVTVSDGEFARMDDGGVDVFLFNRSFGLAYGDLVEANINGKTATPTIEAQRLSDGTPVGSPVTLAASIDHGTMDIHHWGSGAYALNPFYDRWKAWYLGSASDVVPQAVYDTQRDLGPTPDPENTESTGSGRLWSHRCPHTYQALLGGAQDPAEADRWVEEQGLRGLYYYYSDKDYAPYQAMPQHYIGTGYAASDGGFSTTFSAELPAGVDFEDSGLTVPHATHLTIDGLLAAAYLYGDGMAARMAIHTVQAVATHLYNNEKWSARAYGRFFKSLGELAPLIAANYAGTANCLIIGATALKSLQSRNRNGAPAPDNGSTAEGGHLDKNTVTEVLSPLGFSAAQIQDIARSDNSWQNCQLWLGLHTVGVLWPRYGLTGGQGLQQAGLIELGVPGLEYITLLNEQLDYCAQWILECTKLGLDIDGTLAQAPRVPVHGFWDDKSTSLATAVRVGEGGDSDNFAYGVGARFILGTMAEMADYYAEPGWWDLAKVMYAYCLAANNFNGDYVDEIIESATILAQTGWEDPA